MGYLQSDLDFSKTLHGLFAFKFGFIGDPTCIYLHSALVFDKDPQWLA